CKVSSSLQGPPLVGTIRFILNFLLRKHLQFLIAGPQGTLLSVNGSLRPGKDFCMGKSLTSLTLESPIEKPSTPSTWGRYSRALIEKKASSRLFIATRRFATDLHRL